MKIKNCIALLCAISIVFGLSSCGVTKKLYGLSEVEVPITSPVQSVPRTYSDLDRPIRVAVTSSVVDQSQMYDDSNLSKVLKKSLPKYTFTPSVKAFAQDATVAYMQQMRFDVTPSADYTLKIDVRTFKMTWMDKKTVSCSVSLRYSLVDEAGESLLPATTVSSTITLAQAEVFGAGLGRAYADALKQINWDRIADYLRIANNPKNEKRAQVNGDGDTALEHTVIRWYIISAPQGADVSWRVVSSTPEVSNTNAKFIGTTPYESTESFDIRGLSYENSGNVQIEISCEKPGYLTQRKRFNLRQAIDQKEISTKFNLIKED